MIKLNKAAIGDRGLMLSAPISDKDTAGVGRWITNGRWAVQRCLVEHGEQMTSTEAMAVITKTKIASRGDLNPPIHKALGDAVKNPALKKYVRLPFMRELYKDGKKHVLAAIYEHLESGEQIFLNLDYVDMMDGSGLFGLFSRHCYAASNASPAYPDTFKKVEDVSAAIMPVRLKTMEEERQAFKSIEPADKVPAAPEVYEPGVNPDGSDK